MSEEKSINFLEQIIENQLSKGDFPNGIVTRFPPEPNGYLHLGHAKSICVNFGLAKKYKGTTNLRFDDTNPETEETEFVESIKQDIEWLGFRWDKELYASNYFQQLYDFAIQLIKNNLAYVDDSSPEEIAKMKGDVNTPGVESLYRKRSIEENLNLFQAMKEGKFKNGEKVLRAKIDLASPNMHFRDPILYRIKHIPHHRTQNQWCIYPMYDFAHGQSDAIENITHSICTLEFEIHKPLYNWLIEKLNLFPSKQYEFARLNLTYTIMSKRKLSQLVKEGLVNGWDDPRMPTLSGIRRRGYTPASIQLFCEKIGVGRRENIIDMSLLEFCIREELNKTANRLMAVFNPIKLVITNYPDNQTELLPIENNPENPNSGHRNVLFEKNLWIEKDDFMEVPAKKYFRLSPQTKVRLKGAYIIEFEECKKDSNGEVIEIKCRYIENSKSGSDQSGISVKGVIHWVAQSASHIAECRLYDRLFLNENPSDEDKLLNEMINPNSLKVLNKVFIENAANDISENERIQFIRKGYFILDKDSTKEKKILNQIVGLKDTWSKENKS